MGAGMRDGNLAAAVGVFLAGLGMGIAIMAYVIVDPIAAKLEQCDQGLQIYERAVRCEAQGIGTMDECLSVAGRYDDESETKGD